MVGYITVVVILVLFWYPPRHPRRWSHREQRGNRVRGSKDHSNVKSRSLLLASIQLREKANFPYSTQTVKDEGNVWWWQAKVQRTVLRLGVWPSGVLRLLLPGAAAARRGPSLRTPRLLGIPLQTRLSELLRGRGERSRGELLRRQGEADLHLQSTASKK